MSTWVGKLVVFQWCVRLPLVAKCWLSWWHWKRHTTLFPMLGFQQFFFYFPLFSLSSSRELCWLAKIKRCFVILFLYQSSPHSFYSYLFCFKSFFYWFFFQFYTYHLDSFYFYIKFSPYFFVLFILFWILFWLNCFFQFYLLAFC
jgi:hypothetical protein